MTRTGRQLLFRSVLLLACIASTAQAQQVKLGAEPPKYKLLRFEEDYRYLQDPAKRTDFWDPIKYIAIGGDPGRYLSFGGETRQRFEYYSHPNFGLEGEEPNGYLLPRFLLHTDLHLGPDFRAFAQLGSHLAPWKDAAEPPYIDRLDMQQAFVDVGLPLAPSADLDPILRVGRQEMVYGSQRLVAIRDAPNVRLNFDGIRLGDSIGGFRIDAFATRPVLQRAGVFDDTTSDIRALWGVYTTSPLHAIASSAGLDLYYFGFENEHALYAVGPGHEERQTLGSRFFGSKANWDWDWEALGQFGRFAQEDIRAWGFSTNTGYTFDAAGWKTRLGLKADFGSGDQDPGDGTLGTLNALFPKLAYFNQAALFGPPNVMDLQPSVTIQPTERLTLIVGYDFLWRATTDDAIYTGAQLPIPGTAGQPGLFTAGQFSFDLVWQVDRHLEIDAGYVRADVGDAMKAAGGHDVDFFYASAGYRF